MDRKRSLAAAALALAVAGSAAAQDQPVDPRTELPLRGEDVIDLRQWDYQELYTDGWRAGDLIGAEAYGPAGDEIGEVANLVVGPDGKILSVIAEVGGTWDIGDTHVNIPWDLTQITAGAEGIRVPVTRESVENYSLFADERLTAQGALAEIQPVDDDLATGPRAWKVTDLTGDLVRLDDRRGYGYVDDVVFNAHGEIQAVVVRPDVRLGRPGYYAYPFRPHADGRGWDPGREYYHLPYSLAEVDELDRFDYRRMPRERPRPGLTRRGPGRSSRRRGRRASRRSRGRTIGEDPLFLDMAPLDAGGQSVEPSGGGGDGEGRALPQHRRDARRLTAQPVCLGARLL
ncbi:MAG TPA: PRC-barrel domain-containing protein [Geminicoccaceae bacterium]|nr:PRC-barrel domain-containing protein [Geminicoccaceae bacterium]